MAFTAANIFRNNIVFTEIQNIIRLSCARNFSSSSSLQKSDDQAGWLSRLIPIRRIDPGKESHSSLLSDRETVYEIQIHSVKPECMEAYLKECSSFVTLMHAKKTGAELAGSWTTEIGSQDEAVHLWKYNGGYPALNEATRVYRTDKEFLQFRLNRNKMLRSRTNQILLPFSFWNEIKPREGKNIYEMRRYTLKPGTMIEWGNNWAQGIKFRQEKNEAVAGFFSNIGEQYLVYHFWAYESLQDRKEIRDNAWRRPGWDDVVANTVPLIRHMSSSILIPAPYSPCQ